MRELGFYFDFISSNAYLAWVRMPELAERFGLRVVPVPTLFAGLLEASGQLGPAEIRPKALWMARNNLRKAALLGISLKPPRFHPFNPLLSLRMCSLELPDAARNSLVTAFFEATWSRQLDPSEPEVAEQLARELGLENPAELLARAQSPENKALLRSRTDDAISRGVFGVPSFEVEQELFWGYDDLPYLEMFLAGEDPLPPDEAKLWGGGSPRPSAMRRRFREELPPTWEHEARSREARESEK